MPHVTPIAPLAASGDYEDREKAVDVERRPTAHESLPQDSELEANLKKVVERQIERSLVQHHEVLLKQIRSLMALVLTKADVLQDLGDASSQTPSSGQQDIQVAERRFQNASNGQGSAVPDEPNHSIRSDEFARKSDLSSIASMRSSQRSSARSSRPKSSKVGRTSSQQTKDKGNLKVLARSISGAVNLLDQGHRPKQDKLVAYVRGLSQEWNYNTTYASSASSLILGQVVDPVPKSTLQLLLSSPLFDVSMGILVCSNAVLVGFEVNYLAAHPDRTSVPAIFFLMSLSYTCIFFVELLLRLISDFSGFLWAQKNTYQLLWNYLDIFIVVSSLLELAFDYAASISRKSAGESGGVSNSNVQSFRVIGIFRLLRLIRVLRFVRFIRSLRMMVYSILHTLTHVFWAMVLLAVIMYVFAILFTSAATTYKNKKIIDDDTPSIPDLEERWGSLDSSMLSLFMSIAAGISWAEIIEPLNRLDSVWTYLFLVYLSFTYFAVLNVVTGVFCQAALQSSNEDQDAMLQSFVRHQQIYTERFKELFKSLDSDDSGTISIFEFADQMYDEEVRNYFASLGLESADALCIFDLLGAAGSGEVKVDEFVMGCLRLKGFARSSDMLKLLHEHRLLSEQITKLTDHFHLTKSRVTIARGLLQNDLVGKHHSEQGSEDMGPSKSRSFTSIIRKSLIDGSTSRISRMGS